MKTPHHKNYTVYVRHQAAEEKGDLAAFYEGIYFVELNQLVTIYFSPAIKDAAAAKHHLPSQLDRPSSSDEARQWLLGYADYVVMGHDDLAGKCQEIEVCFENSTEKRRCQLCFITQAELKQYQQELARLAEQVAGIYDNRRYEEVKEWPVIQYIEQHILGRLFVHPNHFQILQRPFEALMSQCVQTLKQHNHDQTSTIYHGYLGRHSFLATYVAGSEPYECGLFCSMHTIPDKSHLPAAGQNRTFWSIQHTEPSGINFHNCLLYGATIWLDKANSSMVQVELFKIWREFDDWWEFAYTLDDKEESLKENTPDQTERLVFHLNNVHREAFAQHVIGYVSGADKTFANKLGGEK